MSHAQRLREVLVVLVLGSVVIVLFAQHISGPIKKITKAVDEVALGNLNVQELNRDEIGQLNDSFRIMTKNVNELIGSVKDSADVVLSSSQVLENIVFDTTISINEVAVSVEEIARSSNDQPMRRKTAWSR
ncbi:HAMP domain-containing protein [Paenibacillus sp. BR2-3]|uniref:HAMP domain-containing protein n=1 Tax=Paenibacillus sp. BR2-3 TaxID=3048494 RepID=UPI00397791CB